MMLLVMRVMRVMPVMPVMPVMLIVRMMSLRVAWGIGERRIGGQQ